MDILSKLQHVIDGIDKLMQHAKGGKTAVIKNALNEVVYLDSMLVCASMVKSDIEDMLASQSAQPTPSQSEKDPKYKYITDELENDYKVDQRRSSQSGVDEFINDACNCADGVNKQGLVFENTGLIKLHAKWQARAHLNTKPTNDALDAERYRTLRELNWIDDAIMYAYQISEHDLSTLDDAIDDAMKEVKNAR